MLHASNLSFPPQSLPGRWAHVCGRTAISTTLTRPYATSSTSAPKAPATLSPVPVASSSPTRQTIVSGPMRRAAPAARLTAVSGLWRCCGPLNVVFLAFICLTIWMAKQPSPRNSQQISHDQEFYGYNNRFSAIKASSSTSRVTVPSSPHPGEPAFDCPAVTHDVAVAHPRYSDPTDCQYFYVCIDGVSARRNGCTFGQVFNEAVGACTAPAEVPEW